MGFELDAHARTRPPRRVLMGPRLRLLFGGGAAYLWGVLGFLCIFGWAFGGQADVDGLFLDPDTAVRIEAVVTSSERTGATANGRPVKRYAFTAEADTGKLTGHSFATGQGPAVGEQVTVLHPPGAPDKARIEGQQGKPFHGLLILVWLAPLVIGLILAILAWRALRRIRLLRDGMMTDATCTSCEPTNSSVNDARIERFTFTFEDDRAETHTFTLLTSMLAETAEGDTAPVLYDPVNPRRLVLLDRLPTDIRIQEDGTVDGRTGRKALIGALIATVVLVTNLAALLG